MRAGEPEYSVGVAQKISRRSADGIALNLAIRLERAREGVLTAYTDAVDRTKSRQWTLDSGAERSPFLSRGR